MLTLRFIDMTAADSEPEEKFKYLRVVIGGIVGLVFILLLMFLLAGRIDYWQGWGFSITVVATLTITSAILAKRAGLVKERLKPGPGTKWWDKVFWVLYFPAYFSIFILGPLDSGRFLWSPALPLYLYIIGYVIFGLSHVIKVWAQWTNEFFSSVVRIQEDRKQTVIHDGPYRFIRHPGYVAGIMMAYGCSLILGSLWSLIPASLVTIILIIRTYLEDTTLQKELDGYSEYTEKTKYRLILGIW